MDNVASTCACALGVTTFRKPTGGVVDIWLMPHCKPYQYISTGCFRLRHPRMSAAAHTGRVNEQHPNGRRPRSDLMCCSA